jgi:DNA-binding transcriptional regulator PaaX
MRKIKELKQNIENFLNSDSDYATATRIALAILALGGVLIIGAMAPNIFQAFGKFKQSRRYSDKQLRNALYNLKRQNLVEIIQEKDDKIKIRLTNKGQVRIKEFSTEILAIPRPKKWDGKWRTVIFDIPNKFTKVREALRRKLKDLKFYQLQKSVWIYPYPCEDEILFIAHNFQIEAFIEILTVENLLHENKIRRFFDL